MNGKPENRIDRIVSDLLRGKRLKLRGGDAEEKAAITAAARLAGTVHSPQRMHPAFRKRLEDALEHAPREGWLTRRAALVAGLGLAAGAATGGLLEKALAPAAPQLAKAGDPIIPQQGTWVDVAALAELHEGQARPVTAGGVSAYVFRRGDTVSAVSNICSHLPCELWWDAGHDVLSCPCHPATFSADGRSLDTAYPLPALNTVQVRVTSAGRVEVLGTA